MVFSSLLLPQERTLWPRSRPLAAMAGSSSHLDWAIFAELVPHLKELLRVPDDAIKALGLYAPQELSMCGIVCVKLAIPNN